jgi:exopolysaccharide biosynthesis protein
MKSLGAWDAVNLDGGSSTAMLAFDENKNSLFRISGTRLSVTAAMVKKTSGIVKQN